MSCSNTPPPGAEIRSISPSAVPQIKALRQIKAIYPRAQAGRPSPRT